MRIIALPIVLVVLLLIEACDESSNGSQPLIDSYQKKSIFNSAWQKQGLGQEEWYYRTTVIDAPANSQSLGIAEGHLLHPDVIRWEITEDMLIGWRSHASVIGAEHEENPGVKHNYRGAPVVAFMIKEHFDSSQEKLAWYQRENIRVDWSKNIIKNLPNETSYMVDSSWLGHPNRLRVSERAIDFTIRHLGDASYDTAAPVLDIRHSFIKKDHSDFEPLPMPDSINKQMGFFRTNYDGRAVYEQASGTSFKGINNAIIFNIWQKNVDENGHSIPVSKRQPKSIIYYSNLLHPDDLQAASQRAVEQWDLAFKTTVFYAQPGRYQSIDQVPAMFVLKTNNCQIDNIKYWFNKMGEKFSSQVESSARVSRSEIENQLLAAKELSDYSAQQAAEISAKRLLEQICAALEFATESLAEPFVYQRLGDLRFNLINAVVDNNTSKWSGYGPMFADPITGETISATANINLKYIDLRAQKISEQIGLLKAKSPDLLASVFGSGSASISRVPESSKNLIKQGLSSSQHSSNIQQLTARSQRVWGQADAGFSKKELSMLKSFEHEREIARDQPAFMDPIALVDDIAMGLALKFVDLGVQERFLKIREAVFSAVLQHEIGHNIGLGHNMAGSSDALNYGQQFWWIAQLPADLKAVRYLLSDQLTIKQLDQCLAANISTQDCLQQKNGMYSSIMDYHASALANLHGLGLYDQAAVKLAYGQIIEVFPRENLAVDSNKVNLSKWLRLNNYRHIPKGLLKSYQAINERKHVKLSWDGSNSPLIFPPNAVPYAYCDDPSGQQGASCLSYDFGPDMKSSAQWLISRYQTQYLLNNFDQVKSLALDIDILNRFSNMMRWFYYYANNDQDFSSSYAADDYLQAIAIGLNHFAHVIGMPESGSHVSAPTWFFEQARSLATTTDRLSPSTVLVPMTYLDECDAKSITKINNQGHIEGRLSYQFVRVPLGVGRPYHQGLAILKKYAIYKLISPMVENNITNIDRNDMVGMSWYNLFPQAVIKILNGVINHRYEDLGLIIDEHANISHRDIISEKTLALIDYKNQTIVMPAIDSDLAKFALNNVIAYLPDIIKQISCQGCRDNIDFGNDSVDKIISYSHLNGYKYQSLKSNIIGADFLLQASRQKERYLKLDQCINSENFRNTDPFCMCVNTVDRKEYNDWVCCEEGSSCDGPTLKPVGTNMCSIADLLRRKNQAKDQLDTLVGLIDELQGSGKKRRNIKVADR